MRVSFVTMALLCALAVAASGLPNGEFQTVLKFDLSGARDAFNAQFGAGEWSI